MPSPQKSSQTRSPSKNRNSKTSSKSKLGSASKADLTSTTSALISQSGGSTLLDGTSGNHNGGDTLHGATGLDFFDKDQVPAPGPDLNGGASTLSIAGAGASTQNHNASTASISTQNQNQTTSQNFNPNVPAARLAFKKDMSCYPSGTLETMFLDKVISNDENWVVQCLSHFGKELLYSDWAGGLCRTSILYAAKEGKGGIGVVGGLFRKKLTL